MPVGSLIPAAVEARAQSRGRMPVAFGLRFFIALALGLLWIVPAWWLKQLIAGMFVWDVCVVLAWLVDLRRLPKPASITVRRTWSTPLSLAVTTTATIELTNSGGSPIRAVAIDDTPVTLRDEPPSLTLTVGAESNAQGQYAVRPRERGDLRLGRLFLRYQTPLGLAERWAAADLSQTVRVLPDLEQAKSHALYLIRSRQVEMERRRKRQRGAGREFESLRDYRQGDDIRDVCWPATARRNHLITRVYQVERSQAVWIVLDAGRLMRAQVHDDARDFRSAKLDYAVDAALSLAQVASQAGDRVGLVAYGRTIQQSIGVGRGALHLRTMLESLAQVHAEVSEADHALAVRTLLKAQTRRALVIWITDFAETPSTPEVIDCAMRMTQRHLVVFAALTQPDLVALARKVPQNEDEMFRHAAAMEVATRREALLRGLRERGVLTLDINPRQTTTSLLNQYLEIKDRNLL